MAKKIGLVFCYFSFFILMNISLLCKANDEGRKTYIVYMGSLPDEVSYSPESHHQSILQSVFKDNSYENYLIRSYKRSFNGFVAKLTEQERQTIASMKEVVSVFPNMMYQTQTTRSWDFMGFRENVPRRPSVESDIIIGVIDTGIWPESDSFKDDGFGPIPKKWKGSCNGGKNFTCNNKIIGAKGYTSDSDVLDYIGHGTHTASTAAGSLVNSASFYGIAKGTARGGVPSSRIAAYKVCDSGGCDNSHILAAFDDAISDGVDILTVSLGSSQLVPFNDDVIAIGSFHAVKKGILTMNSAGNSGPMSMSTVSVAPWMLSVAASSIDRHVIDKVILGDGTTVVGNSVNSFALNDTSRPLVHGKDVRSPECDTKSAGLCMTGCIDKKLATGKIVLCDGFDGQFSVYYDGAIGALLNYSDNGNLSSVTPFPATLMTPKNYAVALSYATSATNPKAKILKSETVKDPFAPQVAVFSSRGPAQIVSDIIKPDISAPGVEILAAYSPLAEVTNYADDDRRVNYMVLSGTSMACPHAAGAAAYVKTFHPDWSPSAIKSALMTTAWPMNSTSDDDEFAYGSGHINPAKATNPGLVYEIIEKDYINLLCNLRYTSDEVRLISGDQTVKCDAEASEKGEPKDLNYPSMTVQILSGTTVDVTFRRRVKNVGAPKSTYKATIVGNINRDHYRVSVKPSVLSFKSLNEEKDFEVSVTGTSSSFGTLLSSSLVWSSGNYSVRSPVVIYTM